MKSAHALGASGFDPARGALFVACVCGWEDLTFPAAPKSIPSPRLIAEESAQLERLRLHLQEAGRG